jgi:putative ABC transport system substrate-binding protein
MRRREFLGLAGGAASWPLAASAQQIGRVAQIGWLDGRDDNDSVSQAVRGSLRDGLAKLGWVESRNLKVEWRFGAGNFDRMQAHARELVSLSPDVLVAGGASPARAFQKATQTIPIVFTGGGDAAIIGLVKNIGRPEGNITGFSNSEPLIAGKWLELLKGAAPHLTRVAIAFNPSLGPTTPYYIASTRLAAQKFSIDIVELPFGSAADLVRAVDAFARQPNGGLILLPPSPLRSTFLELAAQHRLPAAYSLKEMVQTGGLLSYSADSVEQHRRAASYVDRILRGAKIADLPVQLPTKYQLTINMKTAKSIGLTIPEAFLLQADELIE